MMLGACGNCGFFGGRCGDIGDTAAPVDCLAAIHLGEVLATTCAGADGYPPTYTNTLDLQTQEFIQYLALTWIDVGLGASVVSADSCTSAVQTAADCPTLLSCMTTAGVSLPAQLPEPPAEGQIVYSAVCGGYRW